MKTKKILLILLSLPILLLTACSGNRPNPDTALSDLDIHIRESPAHTETNPFDLMEVHFIDVGEGDAILITQGDRAMLVDGGPADMGTTVFTYLRNQGIEGLAYIVATHPFADHVGGLPDVLRRMSVGTVLLPMVYHDTPAYYAFLLAVEESGANAAVPFAGHTFNLGDAVVTVLSPSHDDTWENRANYSIVLRVEFGSTSFLLMGDAMREIEANLLDSAALLSSDVLKVARHGASSATTSGFLDAVNPSIAVISAGEDNSFLSQEVLRRLANAGVHTFRTDLHGTVVITSDGTTLAVSVERQPG
jgi:competence protein ComEC